MEPKSPIACTLIPFTVLKLTFVKEQEIYFVGIACTLIPFTVLKLQPEVA